MSSTSTAPTDPSCRPHRALLPLLVIFTLALGLATAWSFNHTVDESLFQLANLVGPTTESLLHGGGLTTCTTAMGTPDYPICFHAGRMPLPSLVIALGVTLFGDHFLRVDFFKTTLLLLPLELAFALVVRRLPIARGRRWATVLLLLVPFTMTAFLADVVNMQVEEGYAYSMLALAVALLLFPVRPMKQGSTRSQVAQAILFAVAVDGVYLAKSSMAPAAVVLLFGYLLLQRRPALRLLTILLVIAAPIGWALHQHHASGRYSLGTSIDGINLHKGNNPMFLSHYPAPLGGSLDVYDSELNSGLHFSDEWSFNDYHQHAAVMFLRTHPQQTMQADLRKLGVFFFSIRKYGSSENGGLLRQVERTGMTIFRLIFWAAILGAAYRLIRPSLSSFRPDALSQRAAAGIFLCLVAACALPYLLGFVFTRHVSVLIYPSILMCCRLIADSTPVCEE
jgi:uncharacterized membrane protein YhaH (DUF805 family)